MAVAGRSSGPLRIPLLIHVLHRQACKWHAAESLYTPRAGNSYPLLSLYRLPSVLKSPTNDAVSESHENDSTLPIKDLYRGCCIPEYEENAAYSLFNVPLGGGFPDSNSITKAGIHTSHTHTDFWCGRFTRCAGAAVRMT